VREHVDGVIFDWGGTLSAYVDVELVDMWKLAAEHLAASTGRDPAQLQLKLMDAEERYWRRVTERWESGSLSELLAVESASLGLDVTEAVLEEVATRHLDAWTPHIRHHEDAVPVLRELKQAGLIVGLLSNTHWPRAFHQRFLERDGLAPWIDGEFYTCELPFSKPHPSTFAHVLESLGLTPARTVYVGDRPIDDVWGAQLAGMRAVWRAHRFAPPLDGVVPDAVIRSLAELPLVIRDLTELPPVKRDMD
jgi:putative hydrolase of the HAD superfamily